MVRFLGGSMKIRVVFLVGLITLQCSGSYNSQGFSFFATSSYVPPYFSQIRKLSIKMVNPPLYHLDKNNGRDYVKNICFELVPHYNTDNQNIIDSYDICYTITSARQKTELTLKKSHATQNIIEILDRAFGGISTYSRSSRPEFLRSIISFDELRKYEHQKTLFTSALMLINHFLPTHKLIFDERDLVTHGVEISTDKAWFESLTDADWEELHRAVVKAEQAYEALTPERRAELEQALAEAKVVQQPAKPKASSWRTWLRDAWREW